MYEVSPLANNHNRGNITCWPRWSPNLWRLILNEKSENDIFILKMGDEHVKSCNKMGDEYVKSCNKTDTVNEMLTSYRASIYKS